MHTPRRTALFSYFRFNILPASLPFLLISVDCLLTTPCPSTLRGSAHGKGPKQRMLNVLRLHPIALCLVPAKTAKQGPERSKTFHQSLFCVRDLTRRWEGTKTGTWEKKGVEHRAKHWRGSLRHLSHLSLSTVHPRHRHLLFLSLLPLRLAKSFHPRGPTGPLGNPTCLPVPTPSRPGPAWGTGPSTCQSYMGESSCERGASRDTSADHARLESGT